MAVEQEKLVLKVMQDKERKAASDDDIKLAHDVLYKLRSLSESNCQIYKQELVYIYNLGQNK
jgi:hypothetical protein